jgi:hypothetical protein
MLDIDERIILKLIFMIFMKYREGVDWSCLAQDKTP